MCTPRRRHQNTVIAFSRPKSFSSTQSSAVKSYGVWPSRGGWKMDEARPMRRAM
jgi:hypothetical protein